MKRCSFIITVLMILSVNIVKAERLTVDVPLANIRSGPGTQYKVVWKVEKYHPIEVIQKSGSWYQFLDFEGDKGWISKDIVRDFPSVIVKKDKCNIRSGPGTDVDVVFTVEKGVPFKVIERKNDWLHVQHADGDKGWIHKDLVW